MKISVDSRRCGAGKTAGIGGIFDRIQLHTQRNESVLVTVPSIKLIEQYYKQFPDATVITSETVDNVQAHLHNAFNNGAELIIITHKAFQESQILSGTRGLYNLIIDEAFDPWRSQTYEQSSLDINFKWDSLLMATPVDETWNTLHLTYDIRTNTISNSSNFVRDIYNTNWRMYIKTEQYESWTMDGTRRVEFVQELNPAVLSDWHSVHVAAAAFEKTFMYWWVLKHGIDIKVTKPFEPHTTQITIHYPDDGHGGTTWSKYKTLNQPEIKGIFRDYVNAVGAPLLRLKNNNDFTVMNNSEVISHNAAGINGKSHYEHVVMESTLNPTPLMGEWLKMQASNYLPSTIKADVALFEARTGYIFYQVGMRCCLRDDKPAHFYVIDNRAVISLAGYFNAPITKEIHYKSDKGPAPLTPTEKQRARRAKKKYPEQYTDKSYREILDDLLRKS
jgi:hypothetical protein